MFQLILLKPLITEKTMRLAQAGQFSFLVAKNVTKPAVAQAVEAQFKVNVLRVTTSKTKAKDRRTGKRRIFSPGQAHKKAMVTLKAGQMIEFFKLPEKKEKPKK